MTTRKLYAASYGAYLYDDSVALGDSDGDFPSMNRDASMSDGYHVCAGVRYLDTDQSNYLTVAWNEDDSANRTLSFLVAGGDRSVTLNENLTLADGYDFTLQALGQANQLTLNEAFTVGDGSAGTLTFGSACALTVELASIINQDLSSDSTVATFANLALSSIADAGVDTDKFLVLDGSNNVDYRTGAEVLSDIGGAASAHYHDGDTLQLDGVYSNGGAFPFTTTGAVTHNYPIVVSNAAWNLDTAGTTILFNASSFTVTTSNGSNHLVGLYAVPTFNATQMGNIYGANVQPKLTSGTIGAVIAFEGAVNLDGGTVSGDALGIDFMIDQEAANTISGDAKVAMLVADFDGTVTGTTYMMYMWEYTGVDYCIYQNGSAPSYFGGSITCGGSINVDTVGTHEYKIGGNRALAMPVDNTNVAIGYQSANAMAAGGYNIAIGYRSLLVANSATALYNIGIGNLALSSLTSGNDNIAFGGWSLASTTTGIYNTGIGRYTLYGNVGGDYNNAIGYRALEKIASGNRNFGLGYYAMRNATGGNDNIAIGHSTLYNTSGSYGIALGFKAVYTNTSGNHNIGIGYQALYTATGHGNIGIGPNTLLNVSTGTYNIGMGYLAGDNLTTGSYNIILGYQIDAPNATADYQLNIYDTFYGIMDNGTYGIGGSTFDGTGRNTFQITGSTQPSGSIADTVQFYEKDSSQGAGHGTLGLYTEEAVEVIGTFTASHKLRIWHNGTEYHIQLDAI